MYPYKLYPSIEEDLVRRALHDLRHLSRDKTNSPLEKLMLVDLILFDLDAPHGSNSRKFALQHLFVSLITESLSAQRAKLDLRQPDEADGFGVAQLAVTLDGRNGNIDLLGWSWLYYFYVRTDLNFTQALFADLVCVDTRSVRRYQQYAMSNLTDCLIHQEWQARKNHRRRYLYTHLPVARPLRLVGREAEFAQAHYIFDQLEWNHMQVTGKRGIGKTAFVQELLRQRIEIEVFDAIIWIDKPRSVDAVRDHLTDQLLLNGRRSELREYLAIHRIGVVIDGVGHLDSDADELRVLLDDLSEAMVVVINQSRLPLKNLPACIQLYELQHADAQTLIRRLAEVQFRGSVGQLSDDELWYVWNVAGGNPGAIHEGIHAVQCEPVS